VSDPSGVPAGAAVPRVLPRQLPARHPHRLAGLEARRPAHPRGGRLTAPTLPAPQVSVPLPDGQRRLSGRRRCLKSAIQQELWRPIPAGLLRSGSEFGERHCQGPLD
jgi:hypothetical protein